MVHERDEKYDGQEDSEYHFSDDQLSYEPESTEVKSTSASKTKAEIMAKIIHYKRPLIGVGVFLVLIFLVYKIIAPSSSTPTTEFGQTGPAATQTTETKTTKTTTTIEPATTMKVVTPAEPQPAAVTPAPNLAPTANANVPQQAMPEPAPQAMQPAAQSPAALPVQQPVQQTTSTETTAAPAPGAPTMVTTTTVNQTPGAAVPSPVMPATSAMSLPDRLTVLETQNAKMQSDYMQKVSEQEAQNTALQGKLQDLNMRMTSIEATLIRLGRMMHEMKGGRSMEDAIGGGAEPVRIMPKPAAAGPRVNYSVQAIIPGRAWLKSEAGDTVTVAEGDVVKDLGRVTKIDPYDGVVQIDSNGRMISLSYGASNE
ncbi:MAG: hypothetical protein P4M14_12850 [Gammaproteobacteria bacterium]|nr:hypothetical protein [Gammaproteobacteria bacterium]